MTAQQNSFTLLVGDDAALLILPAGLKKASPVLTKSHTDEESQAVLEMLALAPHLPVTILADIQSQDYKIETLPPVALFDREKILKRRLEQTYPHAPLRLAKTFSKAEALFMHLEEQSPVGLWLNRLEKGPNPSGLVSLLPIESQGILPRLVPAAQKGWGILLSAHKTGGYRQIITREGTFVFTRLTPPLPDTTHPDHIAESLHQDIKATRTYLSRLGLDDQTPLHLAAILPARLHKAFQAKKMPVASRILFTPREASARLSLTMPPQPDEPSGDMVHALWFRAAHKPLTNLIRPHEEQTLHTQKIKYFGNRLALILASAALLIFLWTGHSLWMGSKTIVKKEQTAITLETKLANARERLAKESAPLDHLRKAIERRRFFTQASPHPDQLLGQIATALGDDARVVDLTWAQNETRLVLLLKDDGARRSFNELTKQKITRTIDNIAFLLNGALEGYDVTVTKYPFPNMPNETITNKGKKDASPLPLATLLITSEGSK